jgi:Ca-activated chloride channel family protein
MNIFYKYQFLHQQFFWLLLLIPAIMLWKWFVAKNLKATIQLSNTQGIKIFQNKTWRTQTIWLPEVLRILAFVAIVIGLARPQNTSETREETTEGIDIVMSLDISSSMLAEDFSPNRIEAVKKLAAEFIDQRKDDRIGLVIFSGESFTQCPITSDHAVLKNLLKDIHSGLVEDGTAIGMGLATAVDRLKDSKAKSKVIILMTDGENNAGLIDPETGMELAKSFGVRVYTIGAGSVGMVPYPVQTPFGRQYTQMESKIDVALLQKIANETGGEYFRATGNRSLKQVYDQIDKLEKTRIEVSSFKHYAEKFAPFALTALILLLLEMLLQMTVYKRIP